MYKVFVNDYPIILTDNQNISTNYKKINFEESTILKLVGTLFNNNSTGFCLICSDLEQSWSIFQSKFEIQKAAGGKVLNLKNEVLFIYRFNKWDLPKGKLEIGESIKECAVREVEEECGIYNLTIQKKLPTTYHIFKREGKTILKITYWFLMNTNFDDVLKPQKEEDITEAVFKNDAEIKSALKNSYQNIKLLF
ncbi:MAG: NUDIX domain-containing protein [Lutibacter sp.]|uniref:NUDIX hydrolase n=1 Tax=Lutibacter sp. TaxID=1925666 RepID=UPI00299E6644|nr:NUDIX domain-containing protein [Lutibacter sp.]MDX1829892.1 NUDIX domain-containing protein [Lutibacter sp.]